jgi:rare lipoprotein A (peptidoglycan hydrolase)
MGKFKTWQIYLFFVLLMGMSFFVLGADVSQAQEAVSTDLTADIAVPANIESLIEITDINNKITSIVAVFSGDVAFTLPPKIFSATTSLQVIELHETMIEPWNADRVSEIYQFEFLNKKAYDRKQAFKLELHYDIADNYLKQIYFFDKNNNNWRPLATRYDAKKQIASATITLPFARVAVFSHPEIKIAGKASWYVYKKGNFAASTAFPKNSRLRVTNLANRKFIDVVINDYGPEKAKHPDRVVDLDSVAFKKIASTRDGIIDVAIEPLYIPEQNGRVLGVKISGMGEKPEVNSVSALITNDNTGEIIYSQNENAVVPLASLTKIVTASVFLDTNPDFNKIVSYNKMDEEHNYQYAAKYEVARLDLKDGDTLTIKDLFYTTLIASTNNTAETLARISGLPRADFINSMNEKVKSWGALNTVFLEPSGLSPQNVSTAQDYAIITKEAFKNLEIAKATIMPQYSFTTIRDKKKKTARNTNKLLNADFKVLGGKTGYLDEAGYCLMTRIKIGENDFTGVILGAQNREQSFTGMSDLLKYSARKLNSL